MVERRVGCIDDKSYLPDEQRAWRDAIRCRLSCLFALLVTPFQESQLLDKQDFQRFVLLGRAMDAALGFKSQHIIKRIKLSKQPKLPENCFFTMNRVVKPPSR